LLSFFTASNCKAVCLYIQGILKNIVIVHHFFKEWQTETGLGGVRLPRRPDDAAASSGALARHEGADRDPPVQPPEFV
jgi:hypothetical protein